MDTFPFRFCISLKEKDSEELDVDVFIWKLHAKQFVFYILLIHYSLNNIDPRSKENLRNDETDLRLKFRLLKYNSSFIFFQFWT